MGAGPSILCQTFGGEDKKGTRRVAGQNEKWSWYMLEE